MTITGREAIVRVSPLYHRGAKRIGLFFDYDPLLIRKIRSLPDRLYSSTHRCWYLPNTEKSWRAFLKTGIPYQVVEHFDNTVSALTNSDNNDIASHEEVRIPELPSEGTMRDSGIGNKVSDRLSIKWYTRHFYVKLPFEAMHVDFIKGISGSWWNAKYGNWVIRATVANLQLLQDRFSYWDEEQLDRLSGLIGQQEAPLTLELFVTPEFSDQFMVRISGYGADVYFMRNLPDRVYEKEFRRWRLPLKPELVARLEEHYRSLGARIVNRIPDKGTGRYQKTGPDVRKWKDYFLSKVNTTHRPVMEDYVNVLIRQHYSKSTLKSYASAMVRYLKFLGSIPAVQSKPSDVNRYLDTFTDRPRSESFYNTQISGIKFYFEKVVFLPEFEIERIERPRKAKTLPTILSVVEVERMLSGTSNLKHATILYTIYSSGFRLSEVLSLRMQDIYWDRNQIMIKAGKGKKDRMVMLSQVLKQLLRLYVDQYQPQYWLFEGQDQEHQYTDRSVQKIVKAAARRAGIQRKVTAHTLRHCFATHLLDGGVDLRYIQELLGHKDIKTTLIYTHVSNRRMSEIESPLDKLNLGSAKDEKKPN